MNMCGGSKLRGIVNTSYMVHYTLTVTYCYCRDALATACVNSFTSLFSGFVIFCYLGYMAKKLGTDIDKVATEGMYPKREH
jgi:hypothetical protein